jgi:phage head maturation protease
MSDETQELGELRTLSFADHTLSVDFPKRKLGLRIVPYNVVAVHPVYGRLMFEHGAFGDVDAKQIRLRMDHTDPPTGLGESFDDQPDAPYMAFGVSKTQRGDDQLTLAKDGTARGVSVGFNDVPGKPQLKLIDGKRTTVYGPASAVLAEVSTTWQPTFPEAGVQYILHMEEKGSGPMAEPQEPAAVAALDTAPIVAAIQSGFAEGKSFAKLEDAADKMLGVVDQWREMSRAQFSIPKGEVRKPKLYDWADVAIKLMKGTAVSPTVLKELALDDVITSEQPGLVPDVFTNDFDDLISPAEPFVDSLREIAPPATGMTMTLPILTSRAAAGSQYGGEKTEVTTTAPKFGTVTFPYVDIMAGADVSIQFIQRGDRSALDLIVQELAEAYGFDSDTKGLAALLNLTTDGPQDGGTLDPEDLQLGAAWQNSIIAYRRAPDSIWMSSTAVRVFIDAKDPTSNGPLYSNLAASMTAGSGTGGTVSGLNPIYVPALDTTGVDVIVGPSRAYAVAKVPALRLQADVPSLAGRDLLLIGGRFFGPRYGSAFTTYTVTS